MFSLKGSDFSLVLDSYTKGLSSFKKRQIVREYIH